ncbi:MAG: hypothetical protein MJK18_05170 [Bdellovibrionales bacterium]|nr:hypothetical protein [Bdellovibrionales bacterium]
MNLLTERDILFGWSIGFYVLLTSCLWLGGKKFQESTLLVIILSVVAVVIFLLRKEGITFLIITAIIFSLFVGKKLKSLMVFIVIFYLGNQLCSYREGASQSNLPLFKGSYDYHVFVPPLIKLLKLGGKEVRGRDRDIIARVYSIDKVDKMVKNKISDDVVPLVLSVEYETVSVADVLSLMGLITRLFKENACQFYFEVF